MGVMQPAVRESSGVGQTTGVAPKREKLTGVQREVILDSEVSVSGKGQGSSLSGGVQREIVHPSEGGE